MGDEDESSNLFLILFSIRSSSPHLVVSISQSEIMLKTILRHGCRLRPALNMRLSTSLHHRLHTWSPSSTIEKSQVRNKSDFSLRDDFHH